MTKKPGRPPLPTSWKRVQISTTIPYEMVVKIKEAGYQYNELVIDGYVHRQECRARIKKLEMAREVMQDHIDRLTKEQED